MIQLQHIKKSYFLEDSEIVILQNISLHIKTGDFIAIVGPSGSGKSTLMNTIGLLDRPTSGEYFLDGKNTSTLSDTDQAFMRSRKIGFVFQNYSLIPRLSALTQVMLPLMYQGVSLHERKERAYAALKRVGLAGHEHKMNEQLSGGQKQRVAIARACITHPSILLADEPTGALDTTTGEEVIKLFRELNTQDGTTIVLITHSNEIAATCNGIIRILDGKIVNS